MTEGNNRLLMLGVLFVELHIGGLNGQPASLGHSIARVCREVQKNLFDLHRIQTNPPQSIARYEGQFNVFPDEPVKSLHDSADHRVQFGYPQGLWLLSAESK